MAFFFFCSCCVLPRLTSGSLGRDIYVYAGGSVGVRLRTLRFRYAAALVRSSLVTCLSPTQCSYSPIMSGWTVGPMVLYVVSRTRSSVSDRYAIGLEATLPSGCIPTRNSRVGGLACRGECNRSTAALAARCAHIRARHVYVIVALVRRYLCVCTFRCALRTFAFRHHRVQRVCCTLRLPRWWLISRSRPPVFVPRARS